MKTRSARRWLLEVNGRVQGVGFRPFVYRLARENNLTGFVNNNSDGVCIEIEGPAEALSHFTVQLKEQLPPLAEVTRLDHREINPNGDNNFTIHASDRGPQANTLISPDAAVCEDCIRELFTPSDRRYHYPFINCTNCGPRFTIISGVPYDRPKTSMSAFPLCDLCKEEYHNPLDRRFHAQPNACPQCGPQVRLHDHLGNPVETHNPIPRITAALRNGSIVAVRGLGGFHLMVDAHNERAVQRLRERKGRDQKPFALMAPNLKAVRKYCQTTPAEEALLQSPAHPIVLMQALENQQLAPSVAPGTPRLGFMLPYTPLHHLIIRGLFPALVVTSGNLSEEPIVTDNQEALETLGGIADLFLLHNRDILQPCDDGVVQMVDGQTQILRRARGWTPAPVFLKEPCRNPILACGGQFKNTLAVSRGSEVFLSQHIGDMDQAATLTFAQKAGNHLRQVLETQPRIMACDSHPNYIISKWARTQDLPLVEVYHHHAHLASVMAENGVSDPCIGIILDGSGYGPDGAIWGGEVLMGDLLDFQRFAWLTPMPLPGSQAAIKQPWRMALSALYTALGPEAKTLDLTFNQQVAAKDRDLIFQIMEKGLNSPLTTSAGRLFDAVSAMLGLCVSSSYEAQAAICLEGAVDPHDQEIYHVSGGGGPLPSPELIRAVLNDIQSGVEPGAVSARFHRSLAVIFAKAADAARTVHGINRVGLSGGVFQNVFFSNILIKILRDMDFQVLIHTRVPCNDGGLALGQIAVADARERSGSCA